MTGGISELFFSYFFIFLHISPHYFFIFPHISHIFLHKFPHKNFFRENVRSVAFSLYRGGELGIISFIINSSLLILYNYFLLISLRCLHISSFFYKVPSYFFIFPRIFFHISHIFLHIFLIFLYISLYFFVKTFSRKTSDHLLRASSIERESLELFP